MLKWCLFFTRIIQMFKNSYIQYKTSFSKETATSLYKFVISKEKIQLFYFKYPIQCCINKSAV